MRSDRSIGICMIIILTAMLAYFIAWIAVSPFVDASHFTQKAFPPREYGLFISATVMAAGLSISMTVASIHTIRRTGLVEREETLAASGDGGTIKDSTNAF